MKKRFIQTNALLGGVLATPFLSGLSAGSPPGSVPEVKNILVILSDDHALHVTGAYGNKVVRTPNIDRLSREGLTFTQAYCNSPICSASRQSLLTGKYPHATGVNLLFTPFPDEGNTTIAEYLKEYGYQTGIFGKNHFNNWMWHDLYKDGLPQHGFDTFIDIGSYKKQFADIEMQPLPEAMEFYDLKKAKATSEAEYMNWRGLPHPVYDKDSWGTYFAEQAIDFMRENRDKPFLAWVAFKDPHHPFYFPVEYAGKYNPVDMPLPDGSPEDDRWVPEMFRYLSDDEKRGIIAAYYTSTEYMDKNIGLLLDALEEMELAENTLVVYLSDNGYLLNDHKRFEKHTMWQEAVHQPMILRMGDHFTGQSSAMVEYVDLFPTLLDSLGISQLDEIQGESFQHVLEDPQATHRDSVFSVFLIDNLAMVKTEEWKYVFTTGRRDLGIGYKTGLGPPGLTHRLYNLKDDPKETRDVSKLPENQEIFAELQQLMLRRFMETHPEAETCPSDLTLEGKLVWFCEPRDLGDDPSLEAIPRRVFSP